MTVTITNPNLDLIADYQRTGKVFKWIDNRCYKITEVQGEMDADAISVTLRFYYVYCSEGHVEAVSRLER